jgi:hypothetical protein
MAAYWVYDTGMRGSNLGPLRAGHWEEASGSIGKHWGALGSIIPPAYGI